MSTKVFRYVVGTIGGLEEVVLAELHSKLKALRQIRTERGSRHGRIFFTYTQSPRQLLELRSVDSCSAVLDELNGVTVGQPGLDYIVNRLARLDLGPGLRLADSLSAVGTVPRGDRDRGFQLAVTMSGSHRFARSELTRRAREALLGHGLRLSQAKNGLRFQLQLRGKRALFTLRLPLRSGAFRYRRELDGPLAHCLGLLIGLGEEDVVVASGCSVRGLEELWTAGNPRLLVGLDEGNTAEKTDPATNTRWVRLQRDWPLRAGSVDCVLGIAGDDQEAGVPMAECVRVMYPGAIAGVLAARPTVFAQLIAAENLPLGILATVPIYLKARKHLFFILERLEETAVAEELMQIDGGGLDGGPVHA